MLSLIVAISQNHVIGKDNKLIWYIPQDLKRFKALTTGHTIIMGRKTFESLGRILPNRKHVVISRDLNFQPNNENVEVVRDISELDKYITSDEECFVIGGASIYKQLMPYANKIYLTVIYHKFKGDAYFPKIDKNVWTIIERKIEPSKPDNAFKFEYITYIRRRH